MRVADVPHGERTTIELAPVTGDSFGGAISRCDEISLHRSDAAGVVVLRTGDQGWEVRGADDHNAAALARCMRRDLPRLCWVAGLVPPQGDRRRVVVQVHELAARHMWPDRIDLAVDERIVEDRRRKQGRMVSADQVGDWLGDQLLIAGPGDAVRVILSGSPHAGTDAPRAFRLHGKEIAADIAAGEDDVLRVTRLVPARPATGDERRPLLLVQGAFRFVDHTVAGRFRGAARSELDQIVARSGSYLQLWSEYNRLEQEQILGRARTLGWLRYQGRRQRPDGCWRFELSGDERTQAVLDRIESMDDVALEAAASPPPELASPAGEGVATPAGGDTQTRKQRAFVGSCAGIHRHGHNAGLAGGAAIDIRPLEILDEDEPPPRGVIFLSLTGDRTRLDRRDRARARIASAECPMPQLGLLIEDQAVPVRRRRTVAPLSPAVRAKFGGEPTQRQIAALDIALNTPDIALIQGPPGTGKTRTIEALQVRLAEVADSDNGISGHTLLTSYQHDAVENVAARTEVFGLPALKLGSRRGRDEVADGGDRWRRERIAAVRADLACLPDMPASQVLRQVRHQAAAYLQAPGPNDDAAAVLDRVADVTRGHLPPVLADRLLELGQRLRSGARRATAMSEAADEERALVRKAVRALRSEPVAFADDGALNATKLQRRLQQAGLCDLLDPAETALLARAAAWDADEAPDFLDDLARLRDDLVDRLAPDERPAGSPTVNADVEALLAEIVDALYTRVRESRAGVDAVLHEYLDDLEHDMHGVRSTVQRHTAVLAATCQQAASRAMQSAKGEAGVFENVIVDEAARANPLDLFIPMAQAERRIILVGDHRQLPHVLEPELERQLERSLSEATDQAIRRSLFERMFQLLRRREQQDGIRRTVTLDVQYRMHPVLGDFVSRVFYEPHGERFTSGRDAAAFAHDVEPYAGAVAAWVHVPLHAGREQGGRSKRRTAEARWIATEARRILEARRDFSVGVITFYAAQVDELLREMARVDLAERVEDDGYRVAPGWQETADAQGRLTERLRVGTVDSFQGKEFDVVILSMTRSNDSPAGDERALRRKYGHLMLANRLCVAMSRQQRLLIVVGDEDMVRHDAARTAVPGLVAFHTLCGGEHGVRLNV